MSKKSVRPATRVHSNRRKAAADCINRALAKSDYLLGLRKWPRPCLKNGFVAGYE